MHLTAPHPMLGQRPQDRLTERECRMIDARLEVKPKTKGRLIMERSALVVLGAAMILMGVIGADLYRDATEWDPLGDYPVQVAFATSATGERVASVSSPLTRHSEAGTKAAVLLPTIYLDESISTTGIKCSAGSEAVNVKGVLSWVSDDPPGRILEVGTGGGLRGPGCVTYVFSNPIPPEVRVAIDKLAANGIMESQWHLTGTETPVKGDGQQGEQRTWVSTTFRVVHTDRPTTP